MVSSSHQVDWLRRSARLAPKRVAFRDEAQRALTYAQLDTQVDSCCRLFARAGLAPGGQIVFRLSAGIPFVVGIFAALRYGALAILPDLHWTTEEYKQIEVGFEGHLLLGEPASKSSVLPLIDDAGIEQLRALTWSTDSQQAIQADAPATRVFTSGSTGTPKAVDLSLENWLWHGLGSSVALGFTQNDHWLCCLPLNHVGGLSILFRAVMVGASVTLHAGFHTEKILGALAGNQAERPTFLSLVPTTFSRLLAADEGCFVRAGLRCVLLGGSPLLPGLRKQANELALPLRVSYGLSEAASQVAVDGWPLFCTRVKLGEQKEILVSGPTVCRSMLSPDGWLHTGDQGSYTQDGRLMVQGRLSTIIISGGENIAPEEVERVLLGCPGVLGAFVYGEPDQQWGEIVIGAVELREGSSLTSEILQAYCRQHLARYKVPKRIEIVSKLPRTALGKVQRS